MDDPQRTKRQRKRRPAPIGPQYSAPPRSARRGSFVRRLIRRIRRSARVQKALLGGAVAAIFVAVGIVGWLVGMPSVGISPDYERAHVRFQDGDYRGSILDLRALLQSDEENVAARLLLGRAFLKIGYASQAETELRRARAAGADLAMVAEPLASSYMQQGKFNELFASLGTDVSSDRLRTKLFVLRGNAYLQTRALDDAQQSFAAAISLGRDLPEAHLGLARVAVFRNQLDVAKDRVDAVLARQPDNAEAYFVAGELHRVAQQTDDALQAYERALALEPEHISARLARAAVQIDLGRDELAVGDLESVWKSRPNDPQAAYLYALTLTKQGQHEQATRIIERASLSLVSVRREFLRNHPPSLLLLGVIRYRSGYVDEARDLLERFIKLDPFHLGARKLLGGLMLGLGEAQATVSLLERFIPHYPQDIGLLVLMSRAYLRLGNLKEGNELLAKAMELQPDNADIRTQLALGRLAAGDQGSAEDELRRAVELGSSGGRAGSLLVTIQLREGDRAGALQTAEQLLKREPRNATVHNLRGVVMLSRQNRAEARASFEKAIALKPDHTTAAHNLAKLDIQEGSIAAAKTRYLNILNVDAENTQAMVELSKIARDEANLDEAIRYLEKARVTDPKRLEPQLDLVELFMLREDSLPKAREMVRRLQAEFPESLAVRVARGRVALASGDRSDAARTFGALAASDAVSPPRLLQYARYVRAAGDLLTARSTLEEALAIAPRYVPARVDLIELELSTGRGEQALELVATLLDETPQLALGQRLHGDALMALKRPAEAIAAYRNAHTAEPTTMHVIRLYRALRAHDQLDAGTRELEHWLSAHADDLAVQRVVGGAYILAGRYDDAQTLFESIVAREPDDAVAVNNLAGLYSLAGDSRALALAERAHQLAPKEPSTLDTLGWALYLNGRAAEGLIFLREAHTRASGNAGIRYHLAATLAKLERTDEALAHLKTAVNSGDEFLGLDDAKRLLEQLTTQSQ